MKKIFKWLMHGLSATWNSIKGVRAAFRETAFQQEFALGVVHYAALYFVVMPEYVKLALAALWPILLALEMVNTAIEAVVDLVSPNRHPLAGRAKDCASAAVGTVALTIVVLWCWAIAKKFALI